MYTVIELQTNGGVTTPLTTVFDDENLAYQKFYQILSFVVVSDVEIHTAMVINEYGAVLRSDTYSHNTNSEE